MPSVVDYASLKQALQDFPHRASIATYVDYFIGAGHERIASDIYVKNDGVGVQQQEETINLAIEPTTGFITVPVDFVQFREVRLGVAGMFDDLVWKDAAWIYEQYPEDAPTGPPAYIARDTVPPAAFVGQLAGNTLTVNSLTSGFILPGPVSAIPMLPNTIITAQLTGTPGGAGTYSVNNAQTVTAQSMTSGGNAFIFGPFPDAGYQLVGTYYSTAPVLSNSVATNWLVQAIPYTLLAACMIELCYFLKDAEQLQLWKGTYDEKLTAFCLADKAKRFAAMGGAVALDQPPIW